MSVRTYPRCLKVLKKAGHTNYSGMRVILDAKAGNNLALSWIKLICYNKTLSVRVTRTNNNFG